MHAEIELTQKQIWELYVAKRAYLASKPKAYVEELLHRAEECRFDATFSIRTAAEINRTAAIIVLGRDQLKVKGAKL